MSSDTELRVIHALRLKGCADTELVAQAAQVPVCDAQSMLDALGHAEQARYLEGRLSGWMLMPAGRARG